MDSIISLEEAKANIPKGLYCYTPLGIESQTDGVPIFKVHSCPYWECYDSKIHGDLPEDRKEQTGGCYCKYLKLGDWMDNGTNLLWDQVKECDVNNDWEDIDAWDALETTT